MSKINKSEFKKIITCDDYKEQDSLDGKKVIAMGYYDVKFPDGTIKKKCLVQKIYGIGKAHININGAPDTYETVRAYIKIKVYGIKIMLYLRRTGIKVRYIQKYKNKKKKG